MKRWSGLHWPIWRDRALVAAASKEKGHVSLRVQLLSHDGDLTAAADLARKHPVLPSELLTLASRVKRQNPATAGAFYQRVAKLQSDELHSNRDYSRLVGHLVQAGSLLPEAEWRPAVVAIRETHRRKTSLITMLDKAGL